MDFKMHRDGKGANPREHKSLCDRSECSQQRGNLKDNGYTLKISRCIAAARERIPGSIDNYVTGVRECSQQRGNLKDDGYI
ncbi:hypothetical protein Phpb_01649 [Photorhabdus namnaonensis]|uniref:Uncharacterized protein n=1 Tax=Photorhabdus namnaonensis TaxID=1851568 RepID=A0A1B8YJR0_9GAMM|nr:hypothetical protein Phpb_01649 [Photorhabdus namnaonensis]